jgi:hypothetical protein
VEVDATLWQECNDPGQMVRAIDLAFDRKEWVRPEEKKLYKQLEPLRQHVSLRKMRLLLCACARRLWDRMPRNLARQAVELAERAADRKVAATQLTAHLRKMQNASDEKRHRGSAADLLATKCVVRLATRMDGPYILRSSTQTLMYALAGEDAGLVPAEWMVWRARPGSEKALEEPARITCGLVHEVLGNPFLELTFPKRWPAEVKGLARSLYEGEDCRSPLHDALLDAGQPDLAEHFKDGWHPRGCWAVDKVLQKK